MDSQENGAAPPDRTDFPWLQHRVLIWRLLWKKELLALMQAKVVMNLSLKLGVMMVAG